jgi:hypothetical protein
VAAIGETGGNEFRLKKNQKYLKLDILNYAFHQKDLMRFLFSLSKDERKFVAREYGLINRMTVPHLEDMLAGMKKEEIAKYVQSYKFPSG